MRLLPRPFTLTDVTGDDVIGSIGEMRHKGHVTSFTTAGEEEKLWDESKMMMSANAYTGAFPIAEALRNGAQVRFTDFE